MEEIYANWSYEVGDKVKLVSYPDENETPEETGVIIAVKPEDGIVEVQVDFMCRHANDDGIRVVVYDDLVATTYGLTDDDARIMVKI